MIRCHFRLSENGHAYQRCDNHATHGSYCEHHRSRLPGWAQAAIDHYFPGARVTRMSPGDGITRYRLETADGSRDLTPVYLGRGAFLGALSMLHAASTHARRIAHDAA